MSDIRDHHPDPAPAPGFPSQITVTVNVVVSGGLVVEFKSTTDGGLTAEQLVILNERIKASKDKVTEAIATP